MACSGTALPLLNLLAKNRLREREVTYAVCTYNISKYIHLTATAPDRETAAGKGRTRCNHDRISTFKIVDLKT
jgi:hypothetical protein